MANRAIIICLNPMFCRCCKNLTAWIYGGQMVFFTRKNRLSNANKLRGTCSGTLPSAALAAAHCRPRHIRRFALKKPCSRKGGVLPSALCYQHPKFSGPFPTCFIRGAGKYGRSASCFRDKRTPVSKCGFINTNHT